MPDVGLLQALMNQTQQVMQQAQSSEKGGFGQDQHGLDFLGNMLAQEKPEFKEMAEELAFSAVQIPGEYQQNLVTQFDGAAQESHIQMQSSPLLLPEVESTAALNQEAMEQYQPEMLLTETVNQNQKSLFIPGIKGEVKVADESVTPEFIDSIGDVPSSQKEQSGYVDYVQPHGSA